MARFMVKASEYKNVCKAVNDRKLAELKKEIIEILKKQDEKEFKKAVDLFESQEMHYSHLEKSITGKWVEKAGYGVGTVRIWKGKKYKKIAPGKWARVFDKEGRGTNIAIGKLIAKVNKIDNAEDLLQFVLENKQRFVDENGKELDILDKVRAAVDTRQETISGRSNDYTYGLDESVNRAKDKLFEGKDKINAKEADLHKISRKISQIPTTELKKRKEKLDRWIENKTRNKRDSLNNTIWRDNYIQEVTAINKELEKRESKKETSKPAEKKKNFKQEMNELYDDQDKAWEGFESGSEIKSTPENSKKFYDRVKKFVDENNIKLSKKHYDEIEDQNGHSFNEALALAGAYGEDAKKKELARNKEYSKQYKGQILDLSMIDEFKESEAEKKEDDSKAYEGKLATQKQVDEATAISNKYEVSRDEMLKKPISTIQKYANLKVEDFEGGIDKFIEYMAEGRSEGVSMDEVGKEFANLINHNVARKIWDDYESGALVPDEKGILKPENKEESKQKTLSEKIKVSEELGNNHQKAVEKVIEEVKKELGAEKTERGLTYKNSYSGDFKNYKGGDLGRSYHSMINGASKVESDYNGNPINYLTHDIEWSNSKNIDEYIDKLQ
ncbi:MAG: hypothetical protein J6T31_06315, partial [Methanobrevibacter sp.]|nr:hypothetical protein [Methanobrevibacter sp.]